MTVIGDAAVAQADTGDKVSVANAVGDVIAQAVIRALTQIFGLETRAQANVLFQLGRRFFGDQVDHPARCAQTVNRIGTVQHFHALDHTRVNSIAFAAAVAQRVGLGYTIDHIQGFAPAQGFTGIGHLLATGREAGNQVAQHRRKVVLNRQLLLELCRVNHRDGIGNGAQRALGAAGADKHLFNIGIGSDSKAGQQRSR